MTEAPPNRVGEVVPFLRVADMERSLRYYVDGMGFAIAQRWVDGGSVRWCRLERGGAALMLQDFQTDTGDRWSPGGELGLGVAIVFICEDAVALWREAAGRGLELSRPFVGNGMWVTAATDPDGYRVEIESPTDVAEGTVLAGDAVPASRDGEGADAGGGPQAPAVETLAERVQRALREEVAVVPYDPAWQAAFLAEKAHLLSCLPADLVRRVEHFGSTAVPGLAAKPVVDMLVEVTDLDATRSRIAPLLEAQGYEYFWRPTSGDDGPPFYAWFIKRDPRSGARTHHIHMVERSFTGHWERLLFRDYLVDHPEVAREYGELKLRLASELARDRAAYTRGKSELVERVTARARTYYAARERILALDEGWKAAARRRDLDAMLAIYAPEAQELLPGMSPVVGHAAIRELYRGLVAAYPRFAHEFDAAEVVVAQSGDLAVVRGTYRFTPDALAPEIVRTGRFVGVWRHRDGDWRLQMNIANEEGAPA